MPAGSSSLSAGEDTARPQAFSASAARERKNCRYFSTNSVPAQRTTAAAAARRRARLEALERDLERWEGKLFQPEEGEYGHGL